MSDWSALILVVDDNEMNRDMLSRRLERQGYQAVVAEDGARALELLPQHPFDLVLLDIMMPNVNGYEVLERAKGDPALRHIPIIMISAVDDLDSVVKCVEMGADDYLFKPFNPILLKARLSASLEKKRLRDQEQRFLKQIQSDDASGGQEANKALVRRYVETNLNQGILDTEAGILSGDCVFISPAYDSPLNVPAMQARLVALRIAFPDLTYTVEDTVAEGNTVAARFTLRGTHLGEHDGLPPTGKPIQVEAMARYRLVDGRIVEERVLADYLGWMQQIGIVPSKSTL